MARIVVLSDIHLSPTHGFFWENWCVARESADAAKADAVIVNGDLAINGPESDAEIAFAATALGNLRTRVMALPGNHDVGDEPPGQDPDQIIDVNRLARWDSSFATDRWALDAGGWRLIGVNAQLFGSGLARERVQDQWLDEQLCTAGRPTALFHEDLANKFSRDCRALIDSPLYRRIFPATRLNPKKTTEGEFETTRRGFRFTTSVGGTLTGRGGDVLIIDDPIKANDAYSIVALEGAIAWFRNTALSRLDNPGESLVIVTMQRLHMNDLSGILIESGWPKLVLPAIATEPANYVLADRETYHRPLGQLLQTDRDDMEALEEIRRETGSRVFAAQYQQNPTPPDGNMIKAAWLRRYQTAFDRKSYSRVVLSCDPAGKAGARNDYTAIAIVGISKKELHLLHVARGHWTVLQMRNQITALAGQWKPDLVLVEDTSSGMGLIQILREETRLNVIGQHSKDDKENPTKPSPRTA
jgi:hypothetical protein